MTSIVYNLKTGKVAWRLPAADLSNEVIAAACDSIPNGFANSLKNLSIAELTRLYNVATGASLKRFSDKNSGVERVDAALADVPLYGGQGRKPKVSLALGVAKSWDDPDVRARRSERHAVRVDGQEFRSVLAAYKQFGLDPKDHIAFRKELKAAAPKKLQRHGKTWQAFER